MLDFLGPFSLILYFLIGALIGLRLFPQKWLKLNGRLQTAGISVTLFAMGASLAASPDFLSDMKTAGWQSFVYAAATIAGSVLLVYILSRIAFQKEGKEQ